ncbi:MAG: ATP phosphoribosyltransferase [Methanosarcinales archaeon Met12]|nr:MAG: ATP phosphoribosyltransferase [Methanosarcinales archaeon Met12]
MKIALPNKGRLYEPCTRLLERAGLHIIDGSMRKLFAKTVNPDINLLFARAPDIPEYVQDGAADLGVTGFDLITEAGVDVEVLLDLKFGKAELVLAVPNDSKIKTVMDLKGKRVATEFPNITNRFFDERKIDVDIIEVSGATEMTPHVGIADAIVDLTSSGTSLVMNRLEAIGHVLSTSARLIANKNSLKQNLEKINEVKTALESVVRAEGKRYLMMNVPQEALERVKKRIPGLSGPTVLRVESATPMMAVHAVVDEDDIFTTINELKRLGAKDILVVPIERMVL